MTFLSDSTGWLPDPVAGLLMLAVAAVAALALHSAILQLLHKLLKPTARYLPILIDHTAGPTRLALLISGVALALQFAPFRASDKDVFGHILLIGFIMLMAWIAQRVVTLVAAVYLRRFRVDVEDNLLARKHVTQVRVLRRAIDTLIVVIAVGAALMTFESVQQYGVSLLASAGAAGLIVGLAAKPLLSNLIAGIQIAITQPIRLDDAVLIEGEWGVIEEITGTFVVVRVWDLRRLIVPLRYFLETPFQN